MAFLKMKKVQNRALQTSASRTALFVCCAAEIVFIFSGAVGSVPWTRLLEDAVCRQHKSPHLAWPSGLHSPGQILHAMLQMGASETTTAERQCKGDDVQADLAALLGIMGGFASIPALVLVIPYSILAKHIDRRPLLVINMIATICGSFYATFVAVTPNINLKFLWLSSLSDLIGGGSPLFFVLLRSIIAENVEVDQLSFVLYILSGFDMLVRLGGTLLGVWLLQFGVVAANFSSVVLGIAVIPILGLLPQCVARVPRAARIDPSLQSASASTTRSYRTREAEQEREGRGGEIRQREHAGCQSSLRTFLYGTSLLDTVKRFTRLPIHNPLCSMFLVIMFVNSLAMDIRGQVRTWASKRYDWPIATVGYILSAESMVGVVILFILPLLKSTRRTSSHDNGKEVEDFAPTMRGKLKWELRVSRASIGFGAAGALVLALANSRAAFVLGLVVMTGAIGFVDAMRAFCTSHFAVDEIQPLYAAVSMVETLAVTLGSPAWGWIFAQAYYGGSAWIGVPFGVCMVLLLCTLGLTLRLRGP